MKSEQLMDRIGTLYTESIMERITARENEAGDLLVVLDLHGLNCKQGKRLVNNTINLGPRTEFKVKLIHGYNSGTALKEMLRNEAWSSRVIELSSPNWNPGSTFMTIAA